MTAKEWQAKYGFDDDDFKLILAVILEFNPTAKPEDVEVSTREQLDLKHSNRRGVWTLASRASL